MAVGRAVHDQPDVLAAFLQLSAAMGSLIWSPAHWLTVSKPALHPSWYWALSWGSEPWVALQEEALLRI